MNESDDESWAAELRANREQKDGFFASHPQSPIPPEERDGFEGLDYFPPDPAYRVDATVTVHADPETVTMHTTANTTVEYDRAVAFAFDIRGREQSLVGYTSEATEGLFVPFRDKTTGQQSYESGRYMELEPSRELDDDDVVPLDFNIAYNPFCAYSDSFACPLPPEENWLDVAIEAGERTPTQSSQSA